MSKIYNIIILFALLNSVVGCHIFKSSENNKSDNIKVNIFDKQDKSPQVVATLGPASTSMESLSKMIDAGLNMARINASHGDHEFQTILIKNLRIAAQKAGRQIKILMDLQGPKIRVDKLKNPLELKSGEEWLIGESQAVAKNSTSSLRFIPTIYKDLVKDAAVGGDIFFDDGFLHAKALEKVSIDGDEFLKIKVIVGGLLKSSKGINLPGSKISAPSLTEKDLEDLKFAVEQQVDAIGLSFVRTRDDVKKTKDIIKELGAHTPVVAKIETTEAVANLSDIIAESDGVMVARGDLAVEIGFAKVPTVQRSLMAIAKKLGKEVITATQMLESMTTSTRPTRAEADNIAHAVWQGSRAVMLSGESAVGAHPDRAVAVMKEIACEAQSAL